MISYNNLLEGSKITVSFDADLDNITLGVDRDVKLFYQADAQAFIIDENAQLLQSLPAGPFQSGDSYFNSEFYTVEAGDPILTDLDGAGNLILWVGPTGLSTDTAQDIAAHDGAAYDVYSIDPVSAPEFFITAENKNDGDSVLYADSVMSFSYDPSGDFSGYGSVSAAKDNAASFTAIELFFAADEASFYAHGAADIVLNPPTDMSQGFFAELDLAIEAPGGVAQGDKLWAILKWNDGGTLGQEEVGPLSIPSYSVAAGEIVIAAGTDPNLDAGGGDAPDPDAPAGDDDSSLPAPYGSMTALEGRMKVDTTQIKHRLHTADYNGGGYKPSEPSVEPYMSAQDANGDSVFKSYQDRLVVTGLRQAAYGTDGTDGESTLKTIPFAIEMDAIEAAIAYALDSQLSTPFDGESPVWKALSDADGDQTYRKELQAKGDMSVGNDALISGGAQVGSTLTVQLDADIDGNVTVGGDLSVDGSADIAGNLDAQAQLMVSGIAGFAGDVTMDKNLDVGGSVNIEGGLTVEDSIQVDGDSNFAGDVTAQGSLTVDGDLDIDGSADFDVTTFDVNASGEIDLVSEVADTTDIDGNTSHAIRIEATVGSVLIEGADGVDIKGAVEFQDDLTIKDTLILTNGAGETTEPDFIIQTDDGLGNPSSITELVHFDGSASGMVADISGNLTVGGQLVVTDALTVDGTTLQATATVSSFGDNIVEINKDNSGGHKSVGVKLDGASSERDFFMGINKDTAKFVLSRETATPDTDPNGLYAGSWDEVGFTEDEMSQINHAGGRVDAAEFHAGHARLEGILAAQGDLKVGASGQEVLMVESTGVSVSGDMVVDESLKVNNLLDVDGDADIFGGLDVHGVFKADDNSGTFSMVVDHSQPGLSGTFAESVLQETNPTVDRLKLNVGDADIQLEGDMAMQKMLLRSGAVVEGEFQAYGKVGLGASGAETRVFGDLKVEEKAELKDSLRVGKHGQGADDYGLIIDEAKQQAGLSISSRELAAGSDAFFTLDSGKDMLVQGNLGVASDVIVSGDIWFDGKLASKLEFVMQDAFTDGDTYTDKDSQDHDLYGYVLASDSMKNYDFGNGIVSRNENLQELLLNVPADVAIAEVNGQKHLSILGVLSSLISGGASTRVEHAVSAAGVGKGVEIDVGIEIHDGTSSAEAKDKMRVYYNGQRLAADDYSIGTNKKGITFNFFVEEDDRLVIDVADPAPGQ